MSVSRILLVAVAAGAGLGCQARDGRRSVSGAVSYRGRPVADGRILFESVDPAAGQAGGGPIKDGRYLLPAPEGLAPGTYTVRITVTAPPENLKVDADGWVTATKAARELLPPEYNVRSTLRCEVTPDGPTEFDYHLDDSKPR